MCMYGTTSLREKTRFLMEPFKKVEYLLLTFLSRYFFPNSQKNFWFWRAVLHFLHVILNLACSSSIQNMPIADSLLLFLLQPQLGVHYVGIGANYVRARTLYCTSILCVRI